MELNKLGWILIAVIAVLYLYIHIIYGIYCWRIAGRKGYNCGWNFVFGLCLGLIAILVNALRPPKSYILNPSIKNELMQIAWMRQVGALSEKDYKRERRVLMWMNEFVS